MKLALAQLVGAFVLFVWWRSRRLGPPVSERLPVEIAGSELVAAVGDLLRRRGNPQRAAATVRADTRRVLAERLGLGPDPAPGALVRGRRRPHRPTGRPRWAPPSTATPPPPSPAPTSSSRSSEPSTPSARRSSHVGIR